jgi:hypothetical protein
MGVHVTTGSTAQNSMGLDIKTSNIPPSKMKRIFDRISQIFWPPAWVKLF